MKISFLYREQEVGAANVMQMTSLIAAGRGGVAIMSAHHLITGDLKLKAETLYSLTVFNLHHISGLCVTRNTMLFIDREVRFLYLSYLSSSKMVSLLSGTFICPTSRQVNAHITFTPTLLTMSVSISIKTSNLL